MNKKLAINSTFTIPKSNEFFFDVTCNYRPFILHTRVIPAKFDKVVVGRYSDMDESVFSRYMMLKNEFIYGRGSQNKLVTTQFHFLVLNHVP